jgi:predicted enzyme related to lactoylglutathione lyase
MENWRDERMVDATIVHFEIPADDVEKLRKFYSELFGWKITHTPMGPIDYWLIETVPIDDKGEPIRPGVNGGMYKRETPNEVPVNYIGIEDIDESIAKLEALGGAIVQGKQEVPGVGYIAVGRDPEGNAVAMIQSLRE